MKKKFLVINPNTEEAMTGQIERNLKELAPEQVELKAVTNTGGPVSIEGHTDEIVSAYHMLKLLGQTKEEYDGYLVACFSNHPSVGAIRELTGKPAVGIAEAACSMAAMLGERFGIVTTSPKWVPMLNEAVSAFGVKEKCAGVFSCGLSVVQLQECSAEEVADAVVDAGRLALLAGAEVICLGCAGMSGLKQRVEGELGVPVVDACMAGMMMLYSLSVLEAKTSRIGMYAPNEKRNTVNVEPEIRKFYE